MQSWQEIDSHLRDEAWGFLTDSEVLTIAEDVLKLIPNVQGPLKSVIESQSPDKKELMQMVLDKLELEENEIFINCGGWSGGAMVLGKLPVPGRPTIWMIVGQGLLRLQ